MKQLTWADIQEDAERKLAEMKVRVRKINRALKIIRRKAASGEPFPVKAMAKRGPDGELLLASAEDAKLIETRVSHGEIHDRRGR